jgi:parvulin-like peptidyl-prolyl isomerase
MPRLSLVVFASITLLATSSFAAPLATAYGKPVERAGFDAELASIKAQFKGNPKRTWTPELEATYKRRLLADRLEDVLVSEAIARHKPVVAEADIEAVIKERRSTFKDQSGFQAWLDANGMTMADLKADARRRLVVDALITSLVGVKAPTAADVERELTQNPDKWGTPDQVRARQIFIKVGANASEAEIGEARRRVMGIYSQVASADKAGFMKAAAKFNEGPSTDKKGLMGEVRRGRMNRKWDEAVFAPDAGDLIGPFQTPFGFHIVFVEARIAPASAKLGDVTPIVKEQLHARFRKDAFKTLLKKLYVEGAVTITEPGVMLDAESFADPDAACATCKR